MRCHAPQHYQDRINRAGGMNRYGGPNFKLAWSQSETMRAGGVWPHDHYAGYREVYLANGSPFPPKHGYWMLLEWDGPETFGGETLWFYLHRDETTGLATLGPYPHRGRYKIAVKLIWTTVDDGVMTIEPWDLNSKVVDMVIPVILGGRNDSVKRRKQFAAAEKIAAERKIDSGIEALMKDAKRPLMLPGKIEDRIRLMEKQWAEFLAKRPKMQRGIQQVKETACQR
jgi:hypothetical protein